MTEYDFSPEAYEQYLHTQNRIARWVDQTEAHRAEFGPEACQLVDHTRRPPYPRQSHSSDDNPHRVRRALSGSSSSSSDPYSRSPQSPGPMPVMGQLPHLYQPAPRHPKTHRHTSSYSHPVYLISPPTSPPGQAYPYAYNPMTGKVRSPELYSSRATPGGSTCTGTSNSYFPTIYAAQTASSPYAQAQPSYTSPTGSYTIYAPPLSSPQKPPHYTSTAAQPYSSAPTIYPVASAEAAYGTQSYYTSPPDQSFPFFTQRYFDKSGKRKKKGHRSR